MSVEMLLHEIFSIALCLMFFYLCISSWVNI